MKKAFLYFQSGLYFVKCGYRKMMSKWIVKFLFEGIVFTLFMLEVIFLLAIVG